jgi:hypothetical protein
VLGDAGTAFTVVFTNFFGASTFFYIRTIHVNFLLTTFAFFSSTAASWFFSGKPTHNKSQCTAHSSVYLYRICRTIQGTGPAFHTGVNVCNKGPVIRHPEYGVGAYFLTFAAACARLASGAKQVGDTFIRRKRKG